MSENENKVYEWGPEDVIGTLKGNQFGLLRAFVQAVLDSPETKKVVYALEMDKILQEMFQEGVKDGKIKPQATSTIQMPAPKTLVTPSGEPLVSDAVATASAPVLELPTEIVN